MLIWQGLYTSSDITQRTFSVEGKDRKHERDVKRDDEDAWREKELMTRCVLHVYKS